MGEYNFDDDDRLLGQTVRLDKITEEINKLEAGAHNSTANKRPKSDKNNAGASQKRMDSPPIKRKETGFSKKLVLAGCCIAAFFVCAFAFNYMMNPKDANSNVEEPIPPTDDVQTPVVDNAESSYFGVISTIGESSISLYNIDDSKSHTYILSGDIKISDKMGDAMPLSELKLGDIVKIGISESGGVASISYSAEVFEKTGLTGAIIDTENRTLKVLEESYPYDEKAIFSYEGSAILPESMDKLDTFNIKGINGKAFSVEITNYHGYFIIENHQNIEGAEVLVDGEKLDLNKKVKISILPGNHDITISGNAVETFSSQIHVAPGEEYKMDLALMQEKTSVLMLKVNVEGYAVFVNGNDVTKDIPLVLNQGSYLIKVTKDGYTPFEKQLELYDYFEEVSVNLQEILFSNLTIDTSPAQAAIHVDGKYIGISPVSFEIAYGDHSVIAKRDGYADTYVDINVNSPDRQLSILLQSAQ